MKAISAHCCAMCWKACCCWCASSCRPRRSSISSARSGARCSCGADPTWSGRGAFCSPSPTSSSSCSRSRSSRRAPTRACSCWRRWFRSCWRMAAWAVMPVADGWSISDINVGVLYLFAVSSLGVYGIIMAGWASNSKYPLLSAPALGGADGVLRSVDRLRHRHRGDVRRLAQPLGHRARAGYAVRPPRLVLAAAAADVHHFLRLRARRDEQAAVRFDRSGIGARRRLFGRIFRFAFPLAVPDRAGRRPDHVGDDGGAVSRRLAVAVAVSALHLGARA